MCFFLPVDVDTVDVELLNEGEEHLLDGVHGVQARVLVLGRQDLCGVDATGVPTNVCHRVCVFVGGVEKWRRVWGESTVVSE